MVLNSKKKWNILIGIFSWILRWWCKQLLIIIGICENIQESYLNVKSVLDILNLDNIKKLHVSLCYEVGFGSPGLSCASKTHSCLKWPGQGWV